MRRSVVTIPGWKNKELVDKLGTPLLQQIKKQRPEQTKETKPDHVFH